jgi:DNA-binding CsgD family transcriptional regulator
MKRSIALLSGQSRILLALIVFQIFCAGFFVYDVTSDIQSLDGLSHFIPEALATTCLFLGIAVEIRVFLELLHRQQRLQQGLEVASGALAEVINTYFEQWNLTEAEQDVAGFTIKGYSIAEIAKLRGSAEATIKAQLNSIYRKSGTQGRAQLVSVLVEDLLRAPLSSIAKSEQSAARLH